ncbi:GNAT family N-acetyltransferase [Peribacillus sp. SCS-155]|uniref:GNAT family N-acetyltransferase n=1 Tax=Peribacillus sedimenti TaxID=3115297 RepID=UPI003905A843
MKNIINKGIQNIKLSLFNPKYLSGLNRFELPPEQEQFTGLPKKMLRLAENDWNRHPVIIVKDDAPVGFFLLNTGTRVLNYTENINALLLTAFSINYKEQGKGYAKAGLLMLNDFVVKHFPAADEIVLAVNMKNSAARALYESIGFMDDGRRTMGPIGEQAVLTSKIIQATIKQAKKTLI